MKWQQLHPLDLSPAQAQEVQRRLAVQVCRENRLGEVRLVAGTDLSPLGREKARSAVVVMSYPGLEVVEVRTVVEAVTFPYIPGLLAFRELASILSACQRLSYRPDLFLVDGQGIAHPRRLGIASHLGLFLDWPAIGCAKSRLVGSHGSVDEAPGSYSPLVDNSEVVGAALRTREGASPVYVSIGHRVDLEAARRWVLALCREYRLPEPLRLAHLAATGRLEERVAVGEQGRLL